MATKLPKIDQKEYLKRYLSNDKDKKKKKKKAKKAAEAKANVRIIDDDLDLSKFQSIQADEVDLFALGEEAPQVVGIIDERPPELRAKEDFGSNKWKVVAANDGFDTTLEVTDVSKRKMVAKMSFNVDGLSPEASRKRIDSDESPPRKAPEAGSTRRRNASDESPPRKPSVRNTEKRNASPASPRRRRHDSDESPPRRQLQDSGPSRSRGRRQDSDESPPRKSKQPPGGGNKHRREDSGYDKSSNRRTHRRDSNNSPPSKSHQRDSDESPPRRTQVAEKSSERSRHRQDSDESPPRRNSGREPDKSRHRNNGSDRNRTRMSPVARHRPSDSDESPPRKSRSGAKSSRDHRNRADSNDRRRGGRHGSDESPPRRRRHGSHEGTASRGLAKSNRNASPGPSVRVKQETNRSDSDQSPPRRSGRSERQDSDESPPRRRRATGRTTRSPARNRDAIAPLPIKEERRSSGDESPQSDAGTGRMTKTLEGKRAGLQDARALREENEKHKRREAEAFDKMAVEHTGRYAETKVREKSGRRRDIEKELREDFEKRKHDEKKKEIYTRWGKGVKQVEDYNTRLQEAAHEMDKPLARYADDKDLDEHLKDQERDGDPMLDYLRNKRKEENKRAGIPEKPQYQGAFPDNRFGVRPGYRWDGVDRSNGFEKRWFETTSKKKATEEEAYKYSVEDM